MTSGERQRRDGSGKRARLTAGDHGGSLYGPKDKKKGAKGKRAKPVRIVPPEPAQRKAAAKRQWQALFDRLEEIKRRDAERARDREA